MLVGRLYITMVWATVMGHCAKPWIVREKGSIPLGIRTPARRFAGRADKIAPKSIVPACIAATVCGVVWPSQLILTCYIRSVPMRSDER